MKKTILFFLVAGISFSSAFAFDKPCKEDAKKLCKDLKGKERNQCLVSNIDQVSAACKEAIEKRQAEIAAKHPCKADRETYCKDVQKGGGRIIKCLRDNADKISPACKTKIDSIKSNKKGEEAKPDAEDPVLNQ